MRRRSNAGRAYAPYLALVACLATLLAGGEAVRATEPIAVPAGGTVQVTLIASTERHGGLGCVSIPRVSFHTSPADLKIVGGHPTMITPGVTAVVVEIPASLAGRTVIIDWGTLDEKCNNFHGVTTLKVAAAAAQEPEPEPKPKPKPVKKTSTKAFALAALSLAERYLDLVATFRRSPDNEVARDAVWQRAVLTAVSWDLARFSKPRIWRLERSKLGVDLRKGQLAALPGFAGDLQKISGYEQVIVDKHEKAYATDADYRSNVDRVTALQHGGKTYAQLSDPGAKADIASQFQKHNGALQVLLQWASNARKSATGVVYGK